MKLELVFPSRTWTSLEQCLWGLTEAISKMYPDRLSHGCLGGEFGYGANWENDAFMMHPYCWCEKEDCPWCGGCQAERGDPKHGDSCYQAKLRLLKEKYGKKESWGLYVPWDHKEYDRDRTKLCKQMGLDPKMGCEVHCNCGADSEWKRQYDECSCDWHRGIGIFRFGAAKSAPNFWHKPSGFKVWWYKYIGRDMEESGEADLAKIFSDCLRSLEKT